MKLARIETAEGILTGEYRDGTVEVEGTAYELGAEATLRAPSDPSAIYCVGRNYAETIEMRGYEKPEQPTIFIKPPVSIVDPDAPIPYPSFSDEVTYAGELAAVIGKRCKGIDPDEAPDFVRGYTILNDIDALDQPGLTSRKAFDGSGPLGPWLETDLDPTAISMRTVIDGEVRQEASTERMMYTPNELIAFLAERFTLHPDDVVSFGSPPNPGLIEPGNEIEITYDGIGTLRNHVIDAPA